MTRFTQIFSILVLAVLAASCTGARWTVKDKNAIDRSEPKVLEQYRFLALVDEVTPQSSVLKLNLMSRTKYRYPQRVLAERNIQEYRLRPGFVALGLSGAALAFYAANSTALGGNRSQTRIWTLNSVGALLAASGFLNLKPIGEPRPTGEERYLKKSGSIIQVDTVKVEEKIEARAVVDVQYGETKLFDSDSLAISGGQVQVPLGEQLNDLHISGFSPGHVDISVQFKDSLYSYRYPVEDVLEPYAMVTEPLTSLRNSANEDDEDNIVADLVEGSQVKIAGMQSKNWYKVLYGISEHYIRKADAEVVWRSSDFNQEEQLVTVPRIPFGDIDVESNIPILRGPQPNAVALVIANQEYSGDYDRRNFAHRDARLIKSYLKTSLGYRSEQIYEMKDLKAKSDLDKVLSKLKKVTNDSTEVTVYLSGYGELRQQERNTQLTILGVNEEGNSAQPVASLELLFKEISRLTSGKLIFLNDIDFSRSTPPGFSINRARELLEGATGSMENRENWAALFSTQLIQPSSAYVTGNGDSKKHNIFPYFWAKALQQRKTSLSDIYQYLERNVSYTARKLHDRPQTPVLLGNPRIDIAAN